MNTGNVFEEYVLNYKYFLLDINSFKGNELLERDNLLASIFYLDQETEGYEGLIKRMNSIVHTLRHLPEADFQLFKRWVKYILTGKLSYVKSLEINDLIDKSNQREVSFMISGLEKNLIKIRDNAVIVTKLLLMGESVEDVAKKLNISEREVEEIKKVIENQ